MKRENIFIITIILIFGMCLWPRPVKNYTDAVIRGDKIFALTPRGTLSIIDANTGDIIHGNIRGADSLTSITIDRKDNIIVIAGGKKVTSLNEQKLSFIPITTYEDEIHAVMYDKQNNAYLVTDSSIVDVSLKKIYTPGMSTNSTATFLGKWLKPSAVFMDKDDNIWIGTDHGEWGGKIFVFNTSTQQFINTTKDGTLPVRSIFSDGHSVYVSGSLDHLSVINGTLFTYSDLNYHLIINSETDFKDHKRTNGEYIGPAAYNKKDSCIYFYSQNGLFKGNPKNDLSKIKDWKRVAQPTLIWKYGQQKAVGYAMNVLKMLFANDGKLYLVTQNNGICVYSKKSFRTLQ